MPEVPFPVMLSDAALARIQALAKKDGRENLVLRIGVKGGGCSGLEYVTKFEVGSKPTDIQTQIGGITLVCDPKSATFLQGSVLNLTANLVGGSFVFENPNSARNCGCGTSFTPKTAQS